MRLSLIPKLFAAFAGKYAKKKILKKSVPKATERHLKNASIPTGYIFINVMPA